MNIINALLVSLFASFSTCLGCVFLFVKIKSQNINKFITFSLSFSIAIMIGISIFDLLPSSIFIIINRYKIWSILLFSLLSLFTITPVFLRFTDVAVITEFSHTLCFSEQFFSLIWICLLYREVTNLTEQEVVEFAPIGFFRVE